MSPLKLLFEVWSETLNYIFGVTKTITNTPLNSPLTPYTRKIFHIHQISPRTVRKAN